MEVAQLQTLATALRAETVQTCVDALAIRNDVALTLFVNSASTQDAWNTAMSKAALFEAGDITKFDSLTPGKREAWALLLDNAPLNMARNKLQKAMVDVWGNTDSVAVLQDCRRKATFGEKYLGGADDTHNTVTAWILNFPGNIGMSDIQLALNKY